MVLMNMLALEPTTPESNGDAGERELPISSLASPANEAMVRAYLVALTGDAGVVDDLSQEVFLRAIARLHLLPNYESPGQMLRGIARLVAREHFRGRRRGRRYLDVTLDLLGSEDEGVAAVLQEREAIELLRAAIEDLPVVSRRILELRYHDGITARAIGTRLGLRPTAVRVTLLRIRERLRRRLEAPVVR